MAVKSIEVVLRANILQYKAALGAAGQQTKQFGKDVTGSSKESKQALSEVSTAAGVLGLGMLAGFGLAARASMNFSAELSELAAVSGATGAELGELRAQAIQAGAATIYSAGEAAKAQVELSKAGVATADILNGGLTGALNLAAAGGLDLAKAAELAAQAMTTFGLGGAAVPRIADTLAAAANKSAAGVEDMAMGMQQAGLVADMTGLSFEETSAILAMFSQNGLRGSDAGTSLKTMLMRLNPTTKEARAQMEQLGLSFYDANGQFVGIEAAAGQLQQAMSKLTPESQAAALSTIFGADAIRGASILAKGGSGSVAEWTAAVTDSGYAADLAAQKNDNLKGDIEALSGSIETALIGSGASADGVLRGLVQTTTMWVNGLGALPAPLSAAVTGTAALGGAGLLTLAAVGKLIPAYTALNASLTAAGGASAKLAGKMSTLARGAAFGGAAVAGLTMAYAAWTKALDDAKVAAGGVADEIEAGAADVGPDQLRAKLAAINTEIGGLHTTIQNSKAPWDADYRAQVSFLGAELEATGVGFRDTIDQMEFLARSTGKSEEETLTWLQAQQAAGITYETNEGLLAGFTGEVDIHALAQGDVMAATEAATMRLEEEKDAFDELQAAVRGATDPFFAFSDALHGNRDAQLQVEEAQKKVTEAINEHGRNSPEAVAAVRALEDANWDAGKSARDLELAANDMTEEIRKNPEALQASMTKLDEWVAAGTITSAQAEILRGRFFEAAVQADRLATPRNMVITADSTQAVAAIGNITAAAQAVTAAVASWSGGIGGAANAVGAAVSNWGAGRGAYAAGRASGGPTTAANMYEVLEGGRSELLHEGGRTFLMAGRDGWVQPLHTGGRGAAGGGSTINVTVHAPNYVGDERAFARQVTPVLVDEIRRYERETAGT